MKRTASLVAAFAVILVLLPTAQGAAAGSCSVSPEQVPLGSMYVFNATGLEPNTIYFFEYKQAGQQFNSNTNYGFVSEDDGTAFVPRDTDWQPGPLVVGPVTVKIRPQFGSGKPVSCSFEVV